jgi:hypothetical protein
MEAYNGNTDVLIEKLRKSSDLNVKYQISLALEPLIPQLTPTQLGIFFVCGAEGYRQAIFDKLQFGLNQLTPRQLLKLLPTENESQKGLTLPYLYDQINKLNSKELTELHKYTDKEDVKENISRILFENRTTISQEDLIFLAIESASKTISQEDLIFLAIESARAAPPEYHEILNQLLQNERNKKETSSSNYFGIVVPFQLQCSSNKEPVMNPNQQHQPIFHFFEYITDKKFFYVDIQGPFANLLKYGDISFDVIQTKTFSNLNNTQGAAIYLTLPPNFSNSLEVGSLSAEHPVCNFIYPFQKLGIVDSIRICIAFKEKTSLTFPVSNKIEVINSSLSPLKHDEITDLITVCFGEIHQFKIKENDTMLSLLEFSCRRFNQNIDQFEIQDLHYRTYSNHTTIVDYQKNGGSSIVRLVKKNSWLSDSNPIPFSISSPTPNRTTQGPFPSPITPTAPTNLFQPQGQRQGAQGFTVQSGQVSSVPLTFMLSSLNGRGQSTFK